MDIQKEYASLMEAYNAVYENQEQLNEEVEIGEEKRRFPFKKVERQMGKAREGSVYGRDTGNEPAPNVSDEEKRNTRRFSRMHQVSQREQRKEQEAKKAGRSSTFYRDTHPESPAKMKKANEEVEYFDEAITSKKGKAKAAEMIANRTTASGRAKSGKGADVSTIKHIGRSEREGFGGTPMTPTMARNPAKSRTSSGTGNKAARRAGLTPTREKPNAWKEEADLFDVILEHLVAEGYAETNEAALAIMANMSEEWKQSIIGG